VAFLKSEPPSRVEELDVYRIPRSDVGKETSLLRIEAGHRAPAHQRIHKTGALHFLPALGSETR
jgi:hypothetical protein